MPAVLRLCTWHSGRALALQINTRFDFFSFGAVEAGLVGFVGL